MEAPPFLPWIVTTVFIVCGLVYLLAPRSVMRLNASLFRAAGQVKNEQRALAESHVLQGRVGGGVMLFFGLFLLFYLIVQPLFGLTT